MAKYITKFETEADFESAASSLDYPNVSYIEESDDVKFTTREDYSTKYLTFVSLADNNTFKCSNAIDYSLDEGNTWTSLAANTDSPSIDSGNTIMWKGIDKMSSTFSSTGMFNAEGNAMSILFGDNFIGQTDLTGKRNGIMRMFNGCTNIISAENLVLPATTLVDKCYQQMFSNCTSLTTAPQLPATTLVDKCYYEMFRGCTNLTTAPELPATTLASYCYYALFYGCNNLTSITCLATDISANNCTGQWTNSVAANGTFTKAASMTSWPKNSLSNKNSIPDGWTVVDA